MIPKHLRIAGFLSYLDPVEIQFDSFRLACISGHNGAGKSSLLDAITWALFGKARGKGADVINLNQEAKAAETALTFEYEGALYRVIRRLPRGKTTTLEFQIWDDAEKTWRPLTEKSVSETQKRIEQTLRLDYETFTNASFFLQGKADSFTQSKPSERKELLSSILGLEAWEEYRQRAVEKRRALENEEQALAKLMEDIDLELAEENARKRRLAELEKSLAQISAVRVAREAALNEIRKNAALLEGQRKLARALFDSLETARAALNEAQARMREKESARAEYASLLERAAQVEAEREIWLQTRAELEALDQLASRFREHEEKRQPLLREIEAERARLERERELLKNQAAAVSRQAAESGGLREKIDEARESLQAAEARLAQRADLELKRGAAREKIASLKAENDSLKLRMNELKERIDSLRSAEGAECPLCGQPLDMESRESTLKQLEAEGKSKGDSFRANKKSIEELEAEISDCQSQIEALFALENERLRLSNSISQMSERLAALEAAEKEWNENGQPRLLALEQSLAEETFAPQARSQLQALEAQLARLGYDAAAHDAKRKAELQGREAEERFRKLETARAVTKQIEAEIASLQADIKARQAEAQKLEAEHQAAAAALQAAQGSFPDEAQAEQELLTLREEENALREEAGGAAQKVKALETLRARKREYVRQREALRLLIARYKILERSFGKNGVPALLIEQALPQIQEKANEILDRLSGGQASIRFETQEEYKDKNREDRKETLEIRISDGSGLRDYEMYSGGEAFRVNFAVRLALSEVLARRKGARLQTLVIDEGFGSQDALGRQRLVEAINLVQKDFEKILVITHLEELKDAFPNRIEIEKTERGSVARVT